MRQQNTIDLEEIINDMIAECVVESALEELLEDLEDGHIKECHKGFTNGECTNAERECSAKELLDGIKMYYNPSKMAFTIVNANDPTDKAVVKKHPEDEPDMEKAMLYCLFKFLGMKPGWLYDKLQEVKIQGKFGE